MRRALVMAAGVGLPPLVLIACGGGGNAISATTAQQQLVAVADRVDTCFGKAGDVRRCTDAQALGALGEAKLGKGEGQVDMTATQSTRYELKMQVDDRTSFSILVQPIGARRRVCEPAGEGGCPKGGAW